MGFSKVMVIGRAKVRPMVRKGDRFAIAEFPIVLEKPYRSASGEDKVERTEVPVVAFGDAALRCGAIPEGGAEVMIEGRLRMEEVKSGERSYTRHVIVADRCEFEGAPPGPPTSPPPREHPRAPARMPAGAAA